jgi:hypothetical protein
MDPAEYVFAPFTRQEQIQYLKWYIPQFFLIPDDTQSPETQEI